MRTYLIVFIGGGVGTMIRYAVNVAFARWFGNSFPFHTCLRTSPARLLWVCWPDTSLSGLRCRRNCGCS